MSRLSLNVLAEPARKPRTRGKAEVGRRKADKLVARLMEVDTLPKAGRKLYEFGRRLREGSQWQKFVGRLADYLRSGLESAPPFKVFVEGNSKLPYYSFSTLPGATCPGAGECLNYCYSYKSWRNVGAFLRQVQNSLLLKRASWVVERAFLTLPAGAIVRLYCDGDVDSFETFQFWMDRLRDRPDIKSYGYSKSWQIIYEYHQQYGVPSNYVLNLSSGGRAQKVTKAEMLSLPFVRGEFVGVRVSGDYPAGFARYDDPEYHRDTRRGAVQMGYTKAFSCPGKCGECCGGNHACGQMSLRGLVIANGIH